MSSNPGFDSQFNYGKCTPRETVVTSQPNEVPAINVRNLNCAPVSQSCKYLGNLSPAKNAPLCS